MITETYVFGASLPPQTTTAAIPDYVGWLVGGLLLGLGIKTLRRPVAIPVGG